MELLTEFFDIADPDEMSAGSIDGLVDSTLKFGAMTMVRGKAFPINSGTSAADINVLHSANPADTVSVSKSWIRVEDPRMQGRTFLIEGVPVLRIRPQLERLPTRPGPPVRVTSLNDVLYKVSATRLLPPGRIVSRRVSSKPLAVQKMQSTNQIAKVQFNSRPGVVLDYNIVNSGSNMVFKGDETYYVSHTVNLSGTTVIEGGAVIKYDTNNNCSLNILGTVQCQTGPYRPAIFTA